MEKRKLIRRIILVILTLGITAVLLFADIPIHSLWWEQVENAGHMFLFGLIALVFLLLVYSHFFKPKPIYQYLAAFFTSSFIGAVTEILQIYGPRDADLWDLIRDVIGAFAALGLYHLYKMNPLIPGKKFFEKFRIHSAAAICLLVLITMYPVFIWSAAYLYRNSEFPVINNFENSFNDMFVVLGGGAELNVIEDKGSLFERENNHCVEVVFQDNYTYPHFEIHEPCPDWRDYNSFAFDVYNKSFDTTTLYLRIEDSKHNFKPNDRYNGMFMIMPGLNNFSLPLSVIKKAPQNRELDMKDIRAIQFFMISPDKKTLLYFDNIRLLN